MIVPEPSVQGGIASVCSGYYDSALTRDYDVVFLESYCDGSKLKKLWKALGCYVRFLRLLRRNPPDLVHIHSSFGPSFFRKLPILKLAGRRGIPVVNHIHGSDLKGLYYSRGPQRRALVRRTYEACDRLVVLSEHWRKEIQRIAPRADIRVIGNYAVIHPEVLEESRMKERFASKQILFLGMLTPAKGSDTFVPVIRAVLRDVPDARFVFAGAGEPAAFLNALTQKEREQVSFPGWIRGAQKEKALAESAIFFFPSQMEAFPMAVLEAMGSGLPVVTTRTGGIPDIVPDASAGTLTEVGDADAMASALTALLTDRALWERQSRSSLAAAKERFSLEKHLKQLEALYEEVLR